MINFSREWSMPNSATFTIPPIKRLIGKYIQQKGEAIIVEPFAGDSLYGTHRNDLNPDKNVEYHEDALDFLKQLPDNFADYVLYDPPYSLSQAKECYKAYGADKFNPTSKMDYWAKVKNEIARVCKQNGTVLCFGWSSNGLGKGRGFRLMEVLLVAHGGSKNDTICTAETKEG
jgi:hypothetical protein